MRTSPFAASLVGLSLFALTGCGSRTETSAGNQLALQQFKACVIHRAEKQAHHREQADVVTERAIAECRSQESNYQDTVQVQIRQSHPDWNAPEVIAEGTRLTQAIRPQLQDDIAARLAKHAEAWKPEN